MWLGGFSETCEDKPQIDRKTRPAMLFLYNLFITDKETTLPAEAFVQASWHQEASDQAPSPVVASCQVGAYKVADPACASFEGPGS